MDLGLTGKRALVTASSRGLGAGIAAALASEGADVAICGRTEERLSAVAGRINAAAGGNAVHIVADLSEPQSAERVFGFACQELGGIDILVNNTGGPPPGLITAPDGVTWSSQFDTMVRRVIELTNHCLPPMRDANWGRIITVGSSGVIQPIPNLGISNTLRSALVGWTKTLAAEIAGHGITANMLVPGRIHTERVDTVDAGNAERLGKSLDEVRTASWATIPAGRYGTVEEFAAVAAFLAGEPASYVTGSVIRCDGGLIRSV